MVLTRRTGERDDSRDAIRIPGLVPAPKIEISTPLLVAGFADHPRARLVGSARRTVAGSTATWMIVRSGESEKAMVERSVAFSGHAAIWLTMTVTAMRVESIVLLRMFRRRRTGSDREDQAEARSRAAGIGGSGARRARVASNGPPSTSDASGPGGRRERRVEVEVERTASIVPSAMIVVPLTQV